LLYYINRSPLKEGSTATDLGPDAGKPIQSLRMSSLKILVAAFFLTAASHHRPHSRVAFGDVTVGEGEEVRTVLALGGGVTLMPGSRAREVVALGGSVDLGEGAQVQRDVTAFGGDISVGAGAHIGRNATTYGGSIEVEQGGSVSGTITPHQGYDFGESAEEETPSVASPVWAVAWGVFEFIALYVLGALMLLVVPRQMNGVIASFTRHPWRSSLIGLLGSMLLPPLLIALFFSLIGILFIPGLLLAVGLAGAMGYAALALFIGRLVPGRLGDYGRLALGVLAVTLLGEIPIVGPVASVVAWLVVFGAVLDSHFGTRPPSLPTAQGSPPLGAASAT
jgi:hypothetical protein